MKLIKYKSLLGSYDFDSRDNVFIGEILGVEGYFSFFWRYGRGSDSRFQGSL